jgi:hypothetical protein
MLFKTGFTAYQLWTKSFIALVPRANPIRRFAFHVLHSRVGPGLTCKHLTRLERLTKDKYSSLSRKYVNYGLKKFCMMDPGPNVIKLFTSVIYECS